MTIIRYDLKYRDGDCYDRCLATIEEHPDGDYIRYKDYEELLEDLEELKKFKSRWQHMLDEV